MSDIDEVIGGLQILKKYQNVGRSYGVNAEHDVLYCGPSLTDLEGKLTEEDRKELERLGWHEDSEGECWAIFV